MSDELQRQGMSAEGSARPEGGRVAPSLGGGSGAARRCRAGETVERGQSFGPIWFGVLGSVTIVLVVLWLAVQPSASGQGNKLADFWSLELNAMGDALAGLASTVAFLWLIVTAFIQRNELQEQRKSLGAQIEELQHTRREFELTRKVQEDHLNSFSEQRFEMMFFEMVRTFDAIVSSLDLANSGGGRTHATGRDCFGTFFKDFRKEYSKGTGTEVEVIKVAWDEFWHNRQSDLGHYFRYLYNCLKIISDQSAKEGGQIFRERHAKLLRAMLSDDELLVIFYSCFAPKGKKFVRFASEFELFDNLPYNRLLHEGHWDLWKEREREHREGKL